SQNDIDRVLSGTNFWTDRKEYLYLKLKAEDYSSLMVDLAAYTKPYTEIINDKDELTLLIARDLWNKNLAKKYVPIASEFLALITCEVQEETVTGYLLEMLKILSPSGIGVYVQGAFTTDHIFVHYADLDKAMEI